MPDVLQIYDMQPAFIGMKVDSMFGNVDTLPAGTDIPFGCVAGQNAAGRAVLPVGANPAGIAVHDHVIDQMNGKYVAKQAVSLMTKGRIWARAGGTCTPMAPAKYDPATGVFSDAGTATLTGCRFRGPDLTFGGIEASDAPQRMVIVETHHPFT